MTHNSQHNNCLISSKNSARFSCSLFSRLVTSSWPKSWYQNPQFHHWNSCFLLETFSLVSENHELFHIQHAYDFCLSFWWRTKGNLHFLPLTHVGSVNSGGWFAAHKFTPSEWQWYSSQGLTKLQPPLYKGNPRHCGSHSQLGGGFSLNHETPKTYLIMAQRLPSKKHLLHCYIQNKPLPATRSMLFPWTNAWLHWHLPRDTWCVPSSLLGAPRTSDRAPPGTEANKNEKRQISNVCVFFCVVLHIMFSDLGKHLFLIELIHRQSDLIQHAAKCTALCFC